MSNGFIEDIPIRKSILRPPNADITGPTLDPYVFDLDADGFDDIVFQMYEATVNNFKYAGAIIVIWGRKIFPDIIDLTYNMDTQNVTMLSAMKESAYNGVRFASGCLNDNKIPDLLIRVRDYPDIRAFRLYYDLFRHHPFKQCPRFIDLSDTSLHYITLCDSMNSWSFGDAITIFDWDMDGSNDLFISILTKSGFVYALFGNQEIPSF